MSAEATETVGAGIRRLRTARGLTQRDLAQPEYSRTLLAAVEAGIRTPTDDLLRHVARRLDVALDDLRWVRPPGIVDELAGDLAGARQALARGEVDEAEAVFARTRAAAVRYGLPDLACWAGYQTGEARLQRGDMVAAIAAFDELRPSLPDVGAAPRAAVVARRAYCQFATGDAAGAVSALEEALTGARQAGSADAQVRLSSALMYAYLALDWRDRARQVEALARPLLAEVTVQEWVAQFLVVAGQLRRGAAELPEAELMFTDAGKLYEELGLTREVALTRWAHGYVLRRVGQLDGAAAAFDAACTVLDRVGATQDGAGAALELAEVRRRQGDLDEAARLARAAADVCARSHHLECMAEADRLLGLVAAAAGRPADAEVLLDRAVQRYGQLGVMVEVVATCRALGELQLSAGRTADAGRTFRRGLEAARAAR
ncbi:helix-turn-helix domain-containing protein [Dactylosporangium sp. NPDC049525]|uniref:helix-turn-helix domain-containing protein n=1 Tax=Dactylosporangium sp. NPDC049525 TaxID=3154730 RepID=UPI00342EF4D4